MFDDIGRKIKGLAKFIAITGIICSVLTGFAILPKEPVSGTSWSYGFDLTLKQTQVILGVVVMIGGSILSWAGSLCLYGFGQLVENSDKLVKKSLQVKVVSPLPNNHNFISASNADINDEVSAAYDKSKAENEPQPEFAFCPQCGNRVYMEEKFCCKCGSKL